MILDEPWRLSPSVALRPEPFGALAYHFGNRKLTFLKRPELVRVVEGLAQHPDVRSALVAVGVPEGQHAAYAAALEGLAEADMIRPRPDVPTGSVEESA
ncbi:mycofactocin biosynthesis chaperone MftB [Nocardioides sp. URHA0020]|uniref:mycofactocin biosynthesis chaperone MftB n=1 Tax=Nocardioides sp. URHA0020 TaxID=1380392 RepID=UPI00048DE415|nr:mycofactocin biosynthesis chaperone MftB [Nocardioides sp. URHA0020]